MKPRLSATGDEASLGEEWIPIMGLGGWSNIGPSGIGLEKYGRLLIIACTPSPRGGQQMLCRALRRESLRAERACRGSGNTVLSVVGGVTSGFCGRLYLAPSQAGREADRACSSGIRRILGTEQGGTCG